MGSINESNKKIKESKKNKPRLCYKNIKSKFILKKIVHYLKRNKLLVIIKHNKKIQKRLNISLND